MATVGKSIRVKGEVISGEDLTIDGHVDGPVICDGCAITIGATATVKGDVIARDITVFGRTSGQLVASEVIDIRLEATVTGRLVSKRLILNEGASVNGRAEPQHLEAALRVARFNQQKGTAPSGENRD